MWLRTLCTFLSSLTGLHNEFSAQLHKFMAHLTDAQHKTVGHTVLYVPDEGPAMAAPEAYKDKELVHRLEGKEHTHSLTLTHTLFIWSFYLPPSLTQQSSSDTKGGVPPWPTSPPWIHPPVGCPRFGTAG